MTLKISIWRTLVCGAILSAMPLAAIARHLHIENSDDRLILEAKLLPITASGNYSVETILHSLDLTELNGPDRFKTGDEVYVHMARGPGKIAYPFAVTAQKPGADNTNTAFAIRGFVAQQIEDKLSVRYRFENFIPNGNLKANLAQRITTSATLELNVNDNATARIMSLEIDGKSYTHRVIENPVDPALTQ